MLNTINNNMFTRKQPTFNGALDGVITQTLRTLNTNPMANAVGIDLFAMVGPRTYIDTRDRNAYAGAETFFREFTGTLIVCLSAAYLARGISKVADRLIKPEVHLNTNSWFSDDSVKFLDTSWKKSTTTNKYVETVLNSVSGQDGKKVNHFKDIDWNKIEWVDESRWNKFIWDDEKFENIHTKLKDKKSITSAIEELINNKEITKTDSQKLLQILGVRLTNALGADSVNAKLGSVEFSTSLGNLLRDTVDLGKDVFTNSKVNTIDAIGKILKINKVKSIGALAIASSLGLTNQYINRKITEKRTGTQGFVGDKDYKNQVNNKKSTKDKSKKFLAQRLLAALGMAAMAISVMRVKSPKDFMKKLEFTGPVTSGNVIKTVYASTLIGRFLASESKDELVETVTRDYLGFLNWLVFGGFAAKGVANLLDKKRESLFNIYNQDGKGVKNWLNNISLKSHNEIAAKGASFAKKNMWKLNVANASGLAYSTIVLGVLLPKLNIMINKMRNKDKNLVNNSEIVLKNNKNNQNISMSGFLNKSTTM